jgi:hypothetical protein
MGVDHVILCYLFSKENKDPNKTVLLTRQLSDFAK